MIPSAIFFSLCLFSIAIFTLLLQRRYLPLRTTPEYLLLSTFLGLFLSSSIIVLVPIDLASSASSNLAITLPERALRVCWRISYWLCFILTWAILPLLLSYSDSGHRSPQKRLLDSLKANARYHMITLSLGSVALFYFLFSNGFNFASVKGMLVAISYCYSLFLAIALMGHGLVAIPRNLLHAASIPGTLKRLQRSAPAAYDKVLESTTNLESVVAEVAALKTRRSTVAPEFQDWIDELFELASPPSTTISRPAIPNVITEQYLATLTARLKLCLHRRHRFQAAWNSLVQSAVDQQAILDSATTRRLVFNHPSRWSLLNPYTRHLYHFHILPLLHYLLGALLAISSAMIILTEVCHSYFPPLAVIRYTVTPNGHLTFLSQLSASFWIGYMCLSAYHSLSVIKVWGTHALVPRNTSGSSACFYASYAARLTVPLAYQFVSFLQEKEVAEKTVFYDFLGRLVNLTPLGEGFNDFFPCLILVPVAANLMGWWGKMGAWCGFGDGLGDDEEGDGAWIEGRDLIERETLGVRTGAVNHAANSGANRGANHTANHPANNPANRGTQRMNYGSAGRERYRDNPDEEEQDGGILGGWVHRVRNTVENVAGTVGAEAPRLWGQITEGAGERFAGAAQGAQRPRWMG